MENIDSLFDAGFLYHESRWGHIGKVKIEKITPKFVFCGGERLKKEELAEKGFVCVYSRNNYATYHIPRKEIETKICLQKDILAVGTFLRNAKAEKLHMENRDLFYTLLKHAKKGQ